MVRQIRTTVTPKRGSSESSSAATSKQISAETWAQVKLTTRCPWATRAASRFPSRLRSMAVPSSRRWRSWTGATKWRMRKKKSMIMWAYYRRAMSWRISSKLRLRSSWKCRDSSKFRLMVSKKTHRIDLFRPKRQFLSILIQEFIQFTPRKSS